MLLYFNSIQGGALIPAKARHEDKKNVKYHYAIIIVPT